MAGQPESVDLHGSFHHQGELLFENIDLCLVPGGWTCLLGPSGSGKTTLLRLIAGLPTGGEFDGTIRYPANAGADGQIAYMAQSSLLPPWLDVAANVVLGARLRGEKPDHEAAARMIEQVGLETHRHKRPAELSGGMRQRVALARTLVENRPIVLLDEPFSALDAGRRAQMQELAFRVFQGKTVLLVTHDPAEAARLGQRIYLLAKSGLEPVPAPANPPIRPLDDPRVFTAQARLLRMMRDQRL